MTDCSSILESTSSSSDVISSRLGVMTPRIRVIRMIRPSSRRVLIGPENNVAFGFAIRGGKEFGTGFFISRVERGSEADVKGLRVGDQIIRVNGYNVDDAVHKELTQFVSSQDRLTLKVRGVGMLPIKDKDIDPLTWHIVPQHMVASVSGLDDPCSKDVRIFLKMAPKTKLGLGICKGPEWKPGIFVQFTKEFSVARDAGLKSGDQILSCNSIDFSDVLFSEAVAVMKSSQTLEMVVRTGAGLGESSGYNSSASSVTGDQSPCWGDHSSKRLSMVREECQPWFDRSTLDRRKISNTSNEGHTPDTSTNKTIIQLSESGTFINNTLISKSNTDTPSCNGLESESVSTSDADLKKNVVPNQVPKTKFPTNAKIADICFVSRQNETKTVIVEVHKSPSEDTEVSFVRNESVPPPKPPALPKMDGGERHSSLPKSTAPGLVSSLSSAISEELKKRQERSTKEINCQNAELAMKQQNIRMGNPSSRNDDEGRHNALMNEFKRAHQRMFKNGFREDEKDERQQELRKVTVKKDEVDHAVTGNARIESSSKIPPPPLPPPFVNLCYKNATPKNNSKPYTDKQNMGPCKTPTPDYDLNPSQLLRKCNSISCTNASSSATEGSDLESGSDSKTVEYNKRQSSSCVIPNPPPVVFSPLSSASLTTKKLSRPVSVTIGEYGNNIARKEPSKFDFIKSNIERSLNPSHGPKKENVSDMLRSELEKTLSRSNLKKRNDLGSGKASTPLDGGAPNAKPVLEKTESLNVKNACSALHSKQMHSEVNNNRNGNLVMPHKVTINIPNKVELQKTDSSPAIPTSGILKNGFGKANINEKSITFGN